MKGTYSYYNEHDPFAAAWLRELIKDGLIAPGEVDERDIQDVAPDELRSFRQVHLFAGIGIWSAALRGAGWSDDRPVLTVSCPCQPFSAAGKGEGFADERHLWPAAFHLISELGASVVFGEQVASADGRTWLDLVSADMEAAAYTGGAFDLCSAGFGAPNIRQRLYFVWLAEPLHSERRTVDVNGKDGRDRPDGGWQETHGEPRTCGEVRGMADADEQGSQGRLGVPECPDERAARSGGVDDGLADSSDARSSCSGGGTQSDGAIFESGNGGGEEGTARPGPVNGFWRDADWLGCRDGKWRAVEPGTFPLATGYPNRVGLLRGAGNAINKEVAQGFIATVRELIG